MISFGFLINEKQCRLIKALLIKKNEGAANQWVVTAEVFPSPPLLIPLYLLLQFFYVVSAPVLGREGLSHGFEGEKMKYSLKVY